MTIILEFPSAGPDIPPMRVTRIAEGATTLAEAIRILRLPPDEIPYIISPKGDR